MALFYGTLNLAKISMSSVLLALTMPASDHVRLGITSFASIQNIGKNDMHEEEITRYAYFLLNRKFTILLNYCASFKIFIASRPWFLPNYLTSAEVAQTMPNKSYSIFFSFFVKCFFIQWLLKKNKVRLKEGGTFYRVTKLSLD